jgi:hypothetical protein
LTLALDKFYKGRSQGKTLPHRLDFFLLRSPLDGAGSVLTARTRCSDAGQYRPAVGFFSTSGFHHFFATKPVRSETSKAERWSNLATIVLLGTRWPIASSGCPRGPRVGYETRCPKHTAPNFSAETRSRTRVSREPDGHRNTFLMHIHADILRASHKLGVPFWKGSSRTPKTLLQKGRPFILRRLIGMWLFTPRGRTTPSIKRFWKTIWLLKRSSRSGSL